MSLALDPQTEQRIQQETLRGHYRDPSVLLNRALDILAFDESWSDEEKAELDRRFEEGMAQCDRGEGIPGDKVREILAQRRAARLAHAG